MATGGYREAAGWHTSTFVRTVVLETEDIAQLVSVPVQVVPAPLPEQMIFTRRFVVSWRSAGNDFEAPDAGFLSCGYGSEGDAVAALKAKRTMSNDAAAVMLAGADEVRIAADGDLKLPRADVAGKALVVFFDGTVDPTGGEGQLVITVDYAVVGV